jgi:hypothetical protein
MAMSRNVFSELPTPSEINEWEMEFLGFVRRNENRYPVTYENDPWLPQFNSPDTTDDEGISDPHEVSFTRFPHEVLSEPENSLTRIEKWESKQRQATEKELKDELMDWTNNGPPGETMTTQERDVLRKQQKVPKKVKLWSLNKEGNLWENRYDPKDDDTRDKEPEKKSTN